jgi:hypothetical protein
VQCPGATTSCVGHWRRSWRHHRFEFLGHRKVLRRRNPAACTESCMCPAGEPCRRRPAVCAAAALFGCRLGLGLHSHAWMLDLSGISITCVRDKGRAWVKGLTCAEHGAWCPAVPAGGGWRRRRWRRGGGGVAEAPACWAAAGVLAASKQFETLFGSYVRRQLSRFHWWRERVSAPSGMGTRAPLVLMQARHSCGY